MAAHLYSPLNVATWEFRILRLLPGSPNSVIQCELEHHTLVAPPRYIALSYCWGDENDRQNAIVNGTETSITRNLEEALQHLRAADIALVWADALCINQNDIQERSLQVRFMKQVYGKAEATYAWLGGNGSDNTVLALQFLHDVSRGKVRAVDEEAVATSEGLTRIRNRFRPTTNRSPNRSNDLELGVSLRPDDLEAPFAALVDLFHRPYWQRRWIIQEAATAKTTQVMCGETVVSIDAISQALKECRTNQTKWTRKHQHSCQFLNQIIYLRKLYQNHRRPGLVETVIDTQTSLQKDERDKVFALLGICHDGDVLVPIPSYEEPLDMLNINLTRELLRRNSAFDIMFVGQQTTRSQKSLPSWCPDWFAGDLTKRASGVAQRPRRLGSAYSMSGNGAELRTLQIQGIEVGRVVAMTSILGTSTFQARDTLASSGTTHPAQKIQYYGSAYKTPLATCLYASTKSLPISWELKHASLAAVYNMPLEILLLVNRSTKWGSRLNVGPTRPFFHSWLLENKDFIMCDRSLHILTSSRAFPPVSVLLWMSDLNDTRHFGEIGIICWLFALGCGTGYSVIGFLKFSRWVQSDQAWKLVIFTIALCVAISSCILVAIVNDLITLGIYPRMGLASRGEKLSSARLVVLGNGAIGLACSDVEIGDRICLIAGCDSPAVLRDAESESQGSGERLLSLVGRSSVVLSKKDAKRYEAFCKVYTRRHGEVDKAIFIDATDYKRLIEQYKAYPEWQHFELI